MVIVGACICAPSFAFADVIDSQTNSSVVGTTTRGSYLQQLGTGLTSNFGGYSSYGIAVGIDASITYRLYECSSGGSFFTGYTSCVDKTGLISVGTYSSTTKTLLLYSTSTPFFTFLPSKYYQMEIQSGQNFKLYGSGIYEGQGYGLSTGGGTLESLQESYFYLFSAGNLSTQGITSITSPTYAQVVSSTNNVNFAFNYYTSSFYNLAGFNLIDNTTLQSIDTSTASSSISSSGSGSFNGYLDLVTGHTYTWTPWIKDSRGINNTLVGSSTFFFVGSQSNQSIPTIQPATWNGCNDILCQGAIVSTSTGILTWNGGTTTSPFGPFGTTFDDLVRNKAPFSYLYDIKQLLYELGNGSSTDSYTRGCHGSDAYYTLPYGKTLESGSSTIKFIDACAVQEYGIVKEIRRTITYALYLITGIGIAGMALSIL